MSSDLLVVLTPLRQACLIEIGALQVLGMADAGFGFEGEVREALRVHEAVEG